MPAIEQETDCNVGNRHRKKSGVARASVVSRKKTNTKTGRIVGELSRKTDRNVGKQEKTDRNVGTSTHPS